MDLQEMYQRLDVARELAVQPQFGGMLKPVTRATSISYLDSGRGPVPQRIEFNQCLNRWADV